MPTNSISAGAENIIVNKLSINNSLTSGTLNCTSLTANDITHTVGYLTTSTLVTLNGWSGTISVKKFNSSNYYDITIVSGVITLVTEII